MGGWLGQIMLGLFDVIHCWQTCMVGELHWANLIGRTGMGELVLGERSWYHFVQYIHYLKRFIKYKSCTLGKKEGCKCKTRLHFI